MTGGDKERQRGEGGVANGKNELSHLLISDLTSGPVYNPLSLIIGAAYGSSEEIRASNKARSSI